ncbi:MAG: c-di-GMP-binding flagellar brake protein YcgR [Methylophilaceae bacterium]|jgi:c-di-GMP-binding flagellar brake protein YcgR
MTTDIAQPGEEDFIVRHDLQVLQILKALKDEENDLKVSFNHAEDDYLTRIIHIAADHQHLYLDITIDEAFNKRMAASPELLIHKDNGIRIKWKAQKHSVAKMSDGHALKMEVPKALVRLQRRELFRLKPPMLTPIPCEIPVSDSENPKMIKSIQYNLVDVSLGGIGLIIQNDLHPLIEVGATFEGCKIDFPDLGQALLNLEVRNIISLSGDKPEEKHRIGL